MTVMLLRSSILGRSYNKNIKNELDRLLKYQGSAVNGSVNDLYEKSKNVTGNKEHNNEAWNIFRLFAV